MSYYINGQPSGKDPVAGEVWRVGSTIERLTSSLDAYEITRKDDATSTKYYLFMTRTKDYYIMRETTTLAVQEYLYYFPKVALDFSADWDNRFTLTYKFISDESI